MSFHVGMRVVCISTERTPEIARFCGHLGADRVQVGGIYVVREIDTRAIHLHGTAALRFEGITGKVRDTSVGPWESGAYPASHFRPVLARKTDIAIFKRLLTPADSKVSV